MSESKALLSSVIAFVAGLASVFGIIEGVRIWAEETPRIVEAFDQAGRQLQTSHDPVSIIVIFIPLILTIAWLGFQLGSKL